MLYVSQLLNTPVIFEGKPFGKIVDMAIFENRPHPPISKFEVVTGKKKITISPDAIRFEKGRAILSASQIPALPYDSQDFYLSEDLLDKQVIDVDGKRLVRVNDILLEHDGELRVAGIDIGIDGILRRLGLGRIKIKQKILPWHLVEAFDYQTGSIRIKLAQQTLNSMHPAELADILEDAGTKERLGIVEVLDPKKAARAIEETDNFTKVSILEGLKPSNFKNVVEKMHLADIADVFHYLNPLKAREVQTALGSEKEQRFKKLLGYSDNTAGGLMHESFFSSDSNTVVKDLLLQLSERSSIPETVVITNGNQKIVGIIQVKNLVTVDKLAILKDILTDRKFVYPFTSLSDIIRLFANYNLRVLPVVDNEKKPIGIILIDDILRLIEEENEKDENL